MVLEAGLTGACQDGGLVSIAIRGNYVAMDTMDIRGNYVHCN